MIKKYNFFIYKNNIVVEEYRDIKGISNNNSIVLNINKIKTTLKDKIFIRENNEFKFELDILNKKSLYILKEHNLKYDIKVRKSTIKEQKNKIIIEYDIETNEDLIKIEIERL